MDLKDKWIEELDGEDRAFLKRFVLASGSLKELASVYAVSYPTIRLRLDRLIEKIKLLEDNSIEDEFERTAKLLHAEGKIDLQTLKELIAAHKKEAK